MIVGLEYDTIVLIKGAAPDTKVSMTGIYGTWYVRTCVHAYTYDIHSYIHTYMSWKRHCLGGELVLLYCVRLLRRALHSGSRAV